MAVQPHPHALVRAPRQRTEYLPDAATMKWLFVGQAAAFVSALAFGRAETWLDWVIVLAAAVTAAGVLFAKIIKPAAVFGVKATQAVDQLLELPDWQREQEERVRDLRHRLRSVESVQEASLRIATEQRDLMRVMLHPHEPPPTGKR